MASGDDFAGALGKALTTSADLGGFGNAHIAGLEISKFNSFIETLDQSKTQRSGRAQW